MSLATGEENRTSPHGLDVLGSRLAMFIAAGLYIVFAVRAGEGTLWLVGELVGVAIFGGVALLGLRGSLWWIVAAWALHPLWDVGLHYLGPGRSFAPETYTIACLSFDLLVAAYIALVYARRRGRRAAA